MRARSSALAGVCMTMSSPGCSTRRNWNISSVIGPACGCLILIVAGRKVWYGYSAHDSRNSGSGLAEGGDDLREPRVAGPLPGRAAELAEYGPGGQLPPDQAGPVRGVGEHHP